MCQWHVSDTLDFNSSLGDPNSQTDIKKAARFRAAFFVIVEDGLQEWRYQQTEFANLFGAAGNVNQVITELGFYRPQYFINRTAKDHFVELFDHLTGSKFTK